MRGLRGKTQGEVDRWRRLKKGCLASRGRKRTTAMIRGRREGVSKKKRQGGVKKGRERDLHVRENTRERDLVREKKSVKAS